MKIHKKIIIKFIIFYFFIVIFFAILYTYFSNDFYYSFSNKEIIFDKNYSYIENYLENSIKSNFRNYYNSNYLVFFNNCYEDFLFDVNDLKIKETRINNKYLESDIFIVLKDSRNNLEYNAVITLKILEELSIKNEDNIYKQCKISTKSSNKILDGLDIEKIFRVKCLDEVLDVGIIIDEKINEKFNQYIINNDGNPSLNKNNFFYYIKFNFPRMFYLSMVTITTLGFGDIVPLTNTTRMLIGLESTIGVIILGWFANKSLKG